MKLDAIQTARGTPIIHGRNRGNVHLLAALLNAAGGIGREVLGGAPGTELTDLGPRSRLDKLINGALRSAIHAHGPITESNLSCASKRVVGAIKHHNREQREGVVNSRE